MLHTTHIYVIMSSLCYRSCYVGVNDEDSEIQYIKAGVPQGSVLGPTLYTLFTSDMPIHNDANSKTLTTCIKCNSNAF